MKNILSVLLWIPMALLEIVLYAAGLVLVPVTSNTHPIFGNNEHPEAPDSYRPGQPDWWRQYTWRAFRNSHNNVRFLLDPPFIMTDPDSAVYFPEIHGERMLEHVIRNGTIQRGYRFVRYRLFSEYWYMRRTKDGEYFEFRIGWKFPDKWGEGFPWTIQLRKGE